MKPHLAGNMGEYAMSIGQLHAEHRVRQQLDHGSFHLDGFFVRHFFFYSGTLARP